MSKNQVFIQNKNKRVKFESSFQKIWFNLLKISIKDIDIMKRILGNINQQIHGVMFLTYFRRIHYQIYPNNTRKFILFRNLAKCKMKEFFLINIDLNIIRKNK